MNYFLEQMKLKDFITLDEYRNWKKQGLNPKKEDLKTDLLPQNVEYEEIIREVLMCNKGESTPIADLCLNMLATNPELNFKKLIRLSGEIVAEMRIQSVRKSKEKGFKDISDEDVNAG